MGVKHTVEAAGRAVVDGRGGAEVEGPAARKLGRLGVDPGLKAQCQLPQEERQAAEDRLLGNTKCLDMREVRGLPLQLHGDQLQGLPGSKVPAEGRPEAAHQEVHGVGGEGQEARRGGERARQGRRSAAGALGAEEVQGARGAPA
eukprot:6431244-Alexandrium_andersonii.AAC.1